MPHRPYGRFLPELGPCFGTAHFFVPNRPPSDRLTGATRPQRALHQHAVDPAAMLEADGLEGAGELEPAGAVQRDRGRIAGIADDRDHLARPKTGADLDPLT